MKNLLTMPNSQTKNSAEARSERYRQLAIRTLAELMDLRQQRRETGSVAMEIFFKDGLINLRPKSQVSLFHDIE